MNIYKANECTNNRIFSFNKYIFNSSEFACILFKEHNVVFFLKLIIKIFMHTITFF